MEKKGMVCRLEQLKGFVDHFIFQNKENGYTVLILVCDDEEITCVGHLHGISEGEILSVEGEYVEHPIYQTQLKIRSYKVLPPEDTMSVQRYLSSGAIKGIGPALAKRIVKLFGKDTLRIMEEEPERLSMVKGISAAKAQEIAAQMEEKRELRQAMIFLQQYGISNTLAVKIYEQYGSGVYAVLKENPYRLAEDIQGIGFKMADEIAEKIGIHTDSDYRIRSGILYTMLLASTEGHTYLPMEILLERASMLLGVEKENIRPAVENLMMDRKLVIKNGDSHDPDQQQVYAMTYYYAELNCARMLKELNVVTSSEDDLLPVEQERMERKIKNLESSQNIHLDELQKKAVEECMKRGVFILSGGPGTGKTTTINTIIRYFDGEGYDILLAAPTGRAAKRMTEATGYEARTIHRMLEINGALVENKRGASFERNEENPLETDVIIIDEVSMVDIFLLQALLKAIPVGTKLILVGDVNQLPSVGAGQCLRDIMQSGCFSTVVLQKIFRQAEESDIVVNAHKINSGEMLTLDNKSRDFFFLERNDVNVIYKHMIQLILEKMPRYVGADSMDIQVLTPMRKGPLGVETLNKILQEYLNPPSGRKKEHLVGEHIFRVGDKVMQIRNNYQLEWEVVSKYNIPIDSGVGIFNGDMGKIIDIDDAASELMVEYDEARRVRYGFSQLEELELAYAVTIHKSQGSEYPAVIMPILSGPRLLFTRNLLYTGVTRAKNCVTILGSKKTLEEMIRNESEHKRYTGLLNRICELRDEI